MFAANAGGAGAGAGLVLILVVMAATFYFIPTIVGAVRRVPNIGSIVVINLLLGCR